MKKVIWGTILASSVFTGCATIETLDPADQAVITEGLQNVGYDENFHFTDFQERKYPQTSEYLGKLSANDCEPVPVRLVQSESGDWYPDVIGDDREPYYDPLDFEIEHGC